MKRFVPPCSVARAASEPVHVLMMHDKPFSARPIAAEPSVKGTEATCEYLNPHRLRVLNPILTCAGSQFLRGLFGGDPADPPAFTYNNPVA